MVQLKGEVVNFLESIILGIYPFKGASFCTYQFIEISEYRSHNTMEIILL